MLFETTTREKVGPPKSKKAKVEAKHEAQPVEFCSCQKLLATSEDKPVPIVPATVLRGGKTKNDIVKLRKIIDDHGFRTSIIASPRMAVSVYKDSCHVDDVPEELLPGKTFLVTMFGLHSRQTKMERFYATSIKNIYCLMLFCNRLREACPGALRDEKVAKMVAENENICRNLGFLIDDPEVLEQAHTMSSSVPKRVANLIQMVAKAEPRNRVETLQHEYERIALWNSTLSNALVALFVKEHNSTLKDVFFKRSHQPQYERITVYLYDPELDYYKPPHFLFMPSVKTAIEKGPETVAQEMIQSFWLHLLRHGYFATGVMKEMLKKDLERFFLSGITHDTRIPLQLNAHFNPDYALSLYLFGLAGSGKSSFVRNFQPALEATIEEHVDPEILARFVKQNLNKRYDVLELELELRPNNNDLSVMSIIQGRRMPLTQSKPGLVVVDLEEMPSNDPTANPNQLKVAQLISQRFSGRKGNYQHEGKAPRNSNKRGISNDASLVTLFTSNYELELPCREAFQRLKMFQNLKTIAMTAVSGPDRASFAKSYMQQCIKDRFVDLNPECDIQLNIPIGEGDTRPLVRHLRMIAFYVCAIVADSLKLSDRIEVSASQKGPHCTVQAGGDIVELKLGTLDNLFPLTPQVFDSRAKQAIDTLRTILPGDNNFSELSIILDFWLARILAPAVVVSNDEVKIQKLIAAVASLKDVHSIVDVDADEYKMMKSLYDPNDTPNLRDDILKFGRGVYVAIELQCPSKDAQLCIRDIIEDSPSMTAFSTAKSALYKTGLLFAVYIKGDITPEVQSRASIIL